MSEKTVLVIDDSTTIRRLCDKELGSQGYRVLVTATAEEGVATSFAEIPDLIILDHQLPGKSGYEVACELLGNPATASIPVVASSTLRKKAYVEYVDCDNVVDMLPKPYTPEALIATVENAINTGVMVVQSQNEGTTVPEVIDEPGEYDLTGTFTCFGLREIIDMLNNGTKTGRLTVECENRRIYVYVDRGRIQAVTASGVDPETVSNKMPESLSELAPVIKFTIGSRRGSEIDGLAGLLDSKVLDPRLLKKLLRIQAAVLLRICFTEQVMQFQFDRGVTAPHLFEELPLDSSLLAILVESALLCDKNELPNCEANQGFVRRAIRGQNLDRAGLSGRHMKLMNLLSDPISVSQIATQLGWPEEEAVRVAHGFEMAELVEIVSLDEKTKVFGVIADGEQAFKVRSFYQQTSEDVAGKLVRDAAGLKLLLRRSRPDVLLVEVGDAADALLEEFKELLDEVRVIGIRTEEGDSTIKNVVETLGNDCTVDSIREVVLQSETQVEG